MHEVNSSMGSDGYTYGDRETEKKVVKGGVRQLWNGGSRVADHDYVKHSDDSQQEECFCSRQDCIPP